jgi:hypothetical protein
MRFLHHRGFSDVDRPHDTTQQRRSGFPNGVRYTPHCCRICGKGKKKSLTAEFAEKGWTEDAESSEAINFSVALDFSSLCALCG